MLHNLRVGDARVSLRFRRRSDGSASHEVLSRRGTLVVVEAPPPNATTTGILEAAVIGIVEHAPGRLARAARLALGIVD